MKKVLIIGLALLLCVGIIDANANRTVRMIDQPSTDAVEDAVLITSDAVDTRNFSKMSFFVDYDETQTSAVYGTLTAEVSWDASTWYTTKISTLDFGPADTPDTSIVITSDDQIVAFFDVRLATPWVRVKFQPTGSDGIDDFIYVVVDFIGIE